MPQIPLQITFRDLAHSDAVDRHVRRRSQKLETFFDRIVGCRVAVEAPNRRHRSGTHYRVRIDLTVPGKELVVSRNPDQNLHHEDLHAAIDDAFDDAERLVEDYARRLRSYVDRPRR